MEQTTQKPIRIIKSSSNLGLTPNFVTEIKHLRDYLKDRYGVTGGLGQLTALLDSIKHEQPKLAITFTEDQFSKLMNYSNFNSLTRPILLEALSKNV